MVDTSTKVTVDNDKNIKINITSNVQHCSGLTKPETAPDTTADMESIESVENTVVTSITNSSSEVPSSTTTSYARKT